MMINAYNETYIEDAMSKLGHMVEYAVYDCDYSANEIFEQFISSGVAEQFGKGNPKYVAGMSGVELARTVIKSTNGQDVYIPPTLFEYRSKEYWSGWIMAYYQWYRNMRFEEMVNKGLSIDKVMDIYILHEADVSKFVDVADEIIAKNVTDKPTNLQRIRKAANMTQKQLSDASGVTLRMIQLYEQRQNNINKAQVDVVVRLSNTLGCFVEDIME